MSTLFVFALSLWLAEPAAPPGTRAVVIGQQKLTLPAGFDVELVAGPPLVDRPIHADFDELGRLYVCESSGTNDKAEKQLADKPHWILRLEDTDGDGHFDRRTKFADRMMFPEGVLWHDGSVYVSAPPSIWKLTDTDGDGVADRREEWLTKTLTGCANDLHGPFAGLDGWIYWCKGAFAEQVFDRPGRKPFVTRAAHIFRRRPDGGLVEPVMTGGMDNPVEVAFTAGGERIFSTTLFQRAAGGRRDGLIHAIYGGVYGKVNAVTDDHPRTGDLMPVLTHLGVAAPAGLTRYESRVFGDEYTGNLFTALFNLHKVTRHILTPDGATFASRDEDFLASDNFDFHPTDVLEDADGSLLVIDTGGWYKLCCPSSQLWKPEALGGIYRVRRRDARSVADPRGLKLDWKGVTGEQLAVRLADERPAVRKRAMHDLPAKGDSALAALEQVVGQAPSAITRQNAVWTLSRSDAPRARAVIRTALGDADETVRQAAIHAISVTRDAAAVPHLIEILAQGAPHNRRAAAEALGRLGHAAAVPVLLTAAGQQLDRILEHSVIFALIEIADPAETGVGLASSNPRTRRAALLALDQMENGRLDPHAVATLLTAPEPEIRETAGWIIGRHAEWGPELAAILERLLSSIVPTDDPAMLVTLLSRFAKDERIRVILASRLQADDASSTEKRAILQAMAQSGMKSLPPEWVAPLGRMVADQSQAAPAIVVLRAVPKSAEGSAELRSALLVAAGNNLLPANVRLEGLAALPERSVALEPTAFEFVLDSVSPEAPPLTRLAAAEVLSKSKLDDRQLMRLSEVLDAASPLEVERLVAPFSQGASDDTGLALAKALSRSAALVSVRRETLQNVFKGYSPAVQPAAESLYRLLDAGTEKQRARIEELLALVPQGDLKRGQVVFNSQRAACSTCHAMGYVGGDIGPDLTRIGTIRTERDLVESIVFPSASFVRSFEPVTVTTTAGKTYSGTIRRDGPEELVLALNAKDTVRIPREEIDELSPGSVSIMPAGLDQQLSPQELADLIVFLKSTVTP